MNKRIALYCLAALAWSAPALAELSIGFVDPRALSVAASESKVGKQHAAEMEKFIKDKRATIGREAEKFKSQVQAFQKEAVTLSDAQRQQREKELQDKELAITKMQSDAEQEVNKKDGEFKKRLDDEMRKVIDEVSKEEKVNLVFNQAGVMYTDTGVNLTPKIVKKLEAALQKLEVKGDTKKK